MKAVIAPNQWQGETNCLIGPFHDRQTVLQFTQDTVDFGEFEAFSRKIIARQDAWYVTVSRLERRKSTRLTRSLEIRRWPS